MSEQFYERFVGLFFNLILLLILVLATIEVILFYIFSQNMVFYLIYLEILIFSVFYGVKCFLQLRDFREALSQGLLILSNNEKSSKLPLLEIEDFEDIPLRACLCYRNGANFEQVAEVLGLKHIQQAKRELIKGLDILLRSYEKHERKVIIK